MPRSGDGLERVYCTVSMLVGGGFYGFV